MAKYNVVKVTPQGIYFLRKEKREERFFALDGMEERQASLLDFPMFRHSSQKWTAPRGKLAAVFESFDKMMAAVHEMRREMKVEPYFLLGYDGARLVYLHRDDFFLCRNVERGEESSQIVEEEEAIRIAEIMIQPSEGQDQPFADWRTMALTVKAMLARKFPVFPKPAVSQATETFLKKMKAVMRT